MSCPNCKGLCNRLIISSDVTFSHDTLVINIPEGDYANKEKYCIVVAQNLPDTTTINAPVAITIGSDANTMYPLMNCDCTNVNACSINSRTRYSVCVHTDISGGVFKLLGRLPCSQCTEYLSSLPVPTTSNRCPRNSAMQVGAYNPDGQKRGADK